MIFNQIVRGRSALQVAWTEKETEENKLAGFRPPILFRSLNPKNVGFLHDEANLIVAYHTYEEKIRILKRRYPEVENLSEVKKKKDNETVRFTDYWGMDRSGQVWNAFLINNRELLRPPKESISPIIPIVVRSAMEFPLDQPGERVVSFIADLIPEWELENKLESMMLTGLKESFWPELYARNKNGDPIDDIQRGAGALNEVDPTFEFVNPPRTTPDFINANMLAQRSQLRVQRASFSDSLYGMGEASTRSGFMFNQLAQAGMGILGATVQAIARSMMEANSIALCMVKKISVKGEATVYAYDEDNNRMRGYTLSADQIHDSYENHVHIKSAPNLSDDLQRLAIGNQLIANQTLSRQTVRENLIPFRIPDDEEQRVLREMMMQDPNLQRKRMRQEYLAHYGVELPEGEPDMKDTPPPQPPQSMQPPQGFPGAALPPQAQGQIPPEAMMGDAAADPAMLDMMMGQQLDPRAIPPGMMP